MLLASQWQLSLFIILSTWSCFSKPDIKLFFGGGGLLAALSSLTDSDMFKVVSNSFPSLVVIISHHLSYRHPRTLQNPENVSTCM